MVLASQDADLSTLAASLFDDRVCSMPTYVQEGFQLLLSVPDHEELVTCNLKIHKFADFLESQLVRNAKPVLGENGTFLKLKEAFFSVP